MYLRVFLYYFSGRVLIFAKIIFRVSESDTHLFV